MTSNFDITRAVKQNSAIAFERLTVVHRFEDLPLLKIRRGIIYFFAGWGAMSFYYFRELTQVLASMDTSRLDLYVVDVDCVPQDFMMRTFGHFAAGTGETLWVRDGRIVSAAGTYPVPWDEVEVSRYTRELLYEDATEQTGSS